MIRHGYRYDDDGEAGEEEAIQARPPVRFVLGGMRGKRGGDDDDQNDEYKEDDDDDEARH